MPYFVALGASKTMNIQKMKPIHLFGEISRVDDEQRIVEGYAFVNESVPGEGGIKLKRSAMEAATADYVTNGTSREMHQPIAAGKPLDVTWDEKGAYLRVKVVDDQAWNKVKEGVYKGFSIGVNAKVMRGKDVTACEWWDSSLVDRGKDKDATFSVWRAVGIDADAEVDVEVYDEADEELERAEGIERAKWTAEKRKATPLKNFGWPSERKYPIEDQDDVDSAAKLIGKAPESMRASIKKRIMAIAKRLGLKIPDAWMEDTKRYAESTDLMRGMFAEVVENSFSHRLLYMALDMLSTSIYMLQQSIDVDPAEVESDVRDAINEFADFVVPIIAAKSWPDPSVFEDDDDSMDRSASPTLTRFEDGKKNLLAQLSRVAELETTISTLATERDESKTELLRVQGLEKAAVERVKELEAIPTRRPPMRLPSAVERAIGAETPNPDAATIKKLQERKLELERMAPARDSKTQDGRAHELMAIKRQLVDLSA